MQGSPKTDDWMWSGNPQQAQKKAVSQNQGNRGAGNRQPQQQPQQGGNLLNLYNTAPNQP